MTMTDNAENSSEARKPVLPPDNRVSLPREWPFRLLGNALILALVFLTAFLTVTVRTNLVGRQIDSLTEEFYVLTSKLGFTRDDILIEGRKKTSRRAVMEVLGLKRGDNILSLDLNELKNRIETLPWVRRADIRRSYFPNILHISLVERKVASIWQISEKFHPIDTEGNVINAPFRPSRPILLIVGEEAPEHINELLEIIKKDNDIWPRVKVANFISKRRWNLILDDIENGITVKLPEENVGQAWKKLVKLDRTQGILKRKLTFIDLRLKNKVIVKLGKMTDDERKKLKENNADKPRGA